MGCRAQGGGRQAEGWSGFSLGPPETCPNCRFQIGEFNFVRVIAMSHNINFSRKWYPGSSQTQVGDLEYLRKVAKSMYETLTHTSRRTDRATGPTQKCFFSRETQEIPGSKENPLVGRRTSDAFVHHDGVVPRAIHDATARGIVGVGAERRQQQRGQPRPAVAW